MTCYTWGDRMEIYSKKLGAKIIPYNLRHSYAIGFLRGGSDMKEQHAMASPLNRLMPIKKRAGKRG
ncbi:hypothetical protein GCM10010912_55550 [Paenibacillus albidus]|uniref:Tyr recombinase domain-containing protein n=1 Tax=Paenibacillus albidus TaxID=2041023 RepID=A0A917FV77_9BACL|nr:hypothetical protein GCM10010912_55550 [Paenibacillus albidus]